MMTIAQALEKDDNCMKRKFILNIFIKDNLFSVMMTYFSAEELTPDVVNGIDMICNGF